jgi:flavin-dependent dehydrogenase
MHATAPCLGSFDVVVVGGGPAGVACALTLRRYTSRSVAIIECNDLGETRLGENVSAAIVPLLDYLGVKDGFLEQSAHVENFAVHACWGRETPLPLDSMRHWSGSGFLLDRSCFDVMLTQAVQDCGGRLYLTCRVEAAVQEQDGWLLNVRHRKHQRFTLRARFLVDATGRKASLAKRLNAVTRRYDQLIGVSRFFELDPARAHDHHLLIEATADGWWYSALLPEHRLVMSFMTDASLWRASSEPMQQVRDWEALLRHAPYSHSRLQHQAIAADTTLTVRPSYSQMLDVMGGTGWVATGDAAASFDPLSSLGIGYAMHSGCHAARAIEHYLDKADSSPLASYAAAVKQQFATYVPTWRNYYQYEQRFTDAPFWQRRHALAAAQVS